MQDTAGSTMEQDIALPATLPADDVTAAGSDPFGVATVEEQPAAPPAEPVTAETQPSWAADLLTFGLLVLLALATFRIFRDREVLEVARRDALEATGEVRRVRAELARREQEREQENADAIQDRRIQALAAVNQKLQTERDELKRANTRLRDLVMSDPLTGLMNAGRFTEQLESELRRSLRIGKPLTLFICDIDAFRAFNETHGQERGDLLLQRIAGQVESLFRRGGDVVARLGPDRYGILAPDTDYKAAIDYAETFRRDVDKHDYADASSDMPELVTVSFGITEVSPDRPHETREVLERTALTLQLAKKKGGNRVLGTRLRVTRGTARESEITDTRAAEPPSDNTLTGVPAQAADGK
jgi:diguanylate cyclase (GGDEF)-like protein